MYAPSPLKVEKRCFWALILRALVETKGERLLCQPSDSTRSNGKAPPKDSNQAVNFQTLELGELYRTKPELYREVFEAYLPAIKGCFPELEDDHGTNVLVQILKTPPPQFKMIGLPGKDGFVGGVHFLETDATVSGDLINLTMIDYMWVDCNHRSNGLGKKLISIMESRSNAQKKSRLVIAEVEKPTLAAEKLHQTARTGVCPNKRLKFWQGQGFQLAVDAPWEIPGTSISGGVDCMLILRPPHEVVASDGERMYSNFEVTFDTYMKIWDTYYPETVIPDEYRVPARGRMLAGGSGLATNNLVPLKRLT